MRYTIILVFSLLLFISCQPQQQAAGEEEDIPVKAVDIDLDKILKRGQINVAVDNSSTSYFIYKGEIMGFEYELLKMLEDYFQIKLNMIVQPSIQEAFKMLNKGEVDIVAFPLTINRKRQKIVAFTDHYITLRHMLVQRKPANWRQMKLHEIEKTLIRNQVDLIGKEVHVLHSSAYIDALEALSEQIGGDIIIKEEDPALDTEQIIKKVADGEYDYSVADENIARVNRVYYPILDVETPVSFPRRIAWAVRKTSPQLLDTLNYAIRALKKDGTIRIIYNKYFGSELVKKRFKSEYASFTEGKLSPYDDLLKKYAGKLGWDWRLLAAMVYQESHFDPHSESWAGAVGLLQMMPATAKAHGITDRTDPEQSLRGGTEYLLWLEKLWQDKVTDPEEQLKFILASYNVGPGHVLDARALARKYGANPDKWEEVKEYLLKLSQRKYYQDPVVKVGYARGSEPVKYVDEIMQRYERYKQLIEE